MPVLIANRFELGDFLSQGGMGAVYLGRDTQTQEPVAIKQLKPDLLTADPDLVKRFIREGEALRALNHPNIVKLLATDQRDGQHYLVMEYVAGGSLADLLKLQPQVPIARVLAIALELADALVRAHHLKIIHRDIKPANVLLAQDGTPRLTDFGIARVGETSITQTGAVVGTIAYLSPEAFDGGALDGRADLWAFGVMLFEMLAGRRPFTGETASALMNAILNKRTPDLEALRPDAPVSLVDLIYRMLEKNKNERIPSARLVGAELEGVIRDTWPEPPERVAIAGSLHRRELSSQAPVIDKGTVTPSSEIHNLPAQPTSFVGREDELAQLAVLLGSEDVRLVTILGAGGMGKTRLALEAAAQHIDQFPDGIYFVDLTSLNAPEHIVTAVAGTIGVQFAPGSDPKQQLLNALHHKNLLLVLDNFEHLLDGAGIVGEMLGAAPHIKILITSRERLSLSSETAFILSGMEFPDWKTSQEAFDYDAVKLFLQSALRAKPEFTLAAEDLKSLARVCRLVAGLPLGIVLTAAWVSILSLDEIAQELTKGLDFLETDMRDIPERQRSIRGVFEQSYRRLSADEQNVFRKLSVFRGGCTRDAAQAVAGASLKTLMALTNKSLLRRDPAGRYHLHELLRQYAEQQLNHADERSAGQEAHATFFAQFLRDRWEDLKGRRQLTALEELDADFENIDVAWRFLVDQQRERDLGEAASSLWFYLQASARFEEGADLFARAVEQSRPVSSTDPENWIKGHLLARFGNFQLLLGRYEFDKYKAVVDEALTILQQADRKEEMVMTLRDLADAGVEFYKYADAYNASEQAFRIAQSGENAWAERHALLGWCRARLSVEHDDAGNVKTFAISNNEATHLGTLDDVMTLSLGAEDYWTFLGASSFAAWVAVQQHQFFEAETFCRQVLQVWQTLPVVRDLSSTYIRLGASLAYQGRDAEAKGYLHRGLKDYYDLGISRGTLIRLLTTIEH